MSEIMDLMNEAESKLSNAAESAHTASTMAGSVTDAANQTRHRQEHVAEIQKRVHQRVENEQPMSVADCRAIAYELETLNERCPRGADIEGWGREAVRMHGIAMTEIQEARELMTKARNIESTRITHGG